MAAPNPVLRVSPSGPLTRGETDPFQQYSGKYFQDDGSLPNYIGKLGTTAASDADKRVVLYRADGPVPVVGAGQLVPLPEISADPLEIGVGEWLVEAVISCGFNTSNPAIINVTGNLQLLPSFLSAAGAAVAAGAALVSTIPRGVVDGITGSDQKLGLIHTIVKRQVIEVTQSHIDANGGPLAGLAVEVTRISATGAPEGNGPYGTDSGWLELTRDCQIFVRRYR